MSKVTVKKTAGAYFWITFGSILYAIGFEDAIYIKRIDLLPGQIVLHSTNPAYPPVTLDLSGDCAEQFRVIGRVLWSGREYR